MAKVISFVALKGGVSKSESCLNLAYGLNRLGNKVLVVDVDPQCNTTNILTADEPLKDGDASKFLEIINSKKKEATPSFDEAFRSLKEYVDMTRRNYDVHHVIEKECDVKDAIIHTRYDGMDLVPSGQGLSLTDMKLKSAFLDPYRSLRTALDAVRDDYDYIIIDNQPFKNALTINSIAACSREGDMVVIPVKFNRGGLEGTYETISTIMEWLRTERLPLDVRILATMLNRNKIDKSWTDVMKYAFGDKMFNTTIRYQAKPIEEASLKKKILLETTNKGVGEDYWNLVKEVNEMA